MWLKLATPVNYRKRWLVRLEELHEVLQHAIAQAGVTRIILFRVFADLLLPRRAQDLDGVFFAIRKYAASMPASVISK